MYKYNGDTILRLSDGAMIPKDTGNTDYVNYLNWVDEGGVTEADTKFSQEYLLEKLLAEVASRRYQSETGGIELDGMFIDTGRDSQNLITGATLASIMNPDCVCNWKTQSGFIELSASALVIVSNAVREHVQACFNREHELTEAIKNGTYTEDMLEQGWPT